MAEYEKQFSVTSINTGGRDGKSELEDGSFEIPIVPPGSKREGLNPEELFALGYSACFHAALGAIKKQEGIDNESVVRHTVNYFQVPNELDIKLGVDIEVGIDGLDEDHAQELIEKAHKVCPYSRAIENGHIDVSLKVIPFQPAAS